MNIEESIKQIVFKQAEEVDKTANTYMQLEPYLECLTDVWQGAEHVCDKMTSEGHTVTLKEVYFALTLAGCFGLAQGDSVEEIIDSVLPDNLGSIVQDLAHLDSSEEFPSPPQD